MIDIIIADDHKQGIYMIELALAQVADCNIVVKAHDGFDLLLQLKKVKKTPTVAIIDINMPKINGITVTQFLRYKYEDIKIIGVSFHHKVGAYPAIIEAGAMGFIYKLNIVCLGDAIKSVLDNKLYVDPDLKNEWEDYIKLNPIKPINNDHHFSKQELLVLLLFTTQLTYEEIAELTDQSVHTVRKHHKTITEKTEQTTRLDIAMFAITYGFVKVFKV